MSRSLPILMIFLILLAACNKKKDDHSSEEKSSDQKEGIVIVAPQKNIETISYDAETDTYILDKKEKVKLAGAVLPPKDISQRCPNLAERRQDMIESHLARVKMRTEKTPLEVVYRRTENGKDFVEIRFPAWESDKFRGKIEATTGKPVGLGKFLNFNKTLIFHGLAQLDESTAPMADIADYRDASNRSQQRKLGMWSKKCQPVKSTLGDDEGKWQNYEPAAVDQDIPQENQADEEQADLTPQLEQPSDDQAQEEDSAPREATGTTP